VFNKPKRSSPNFRAVTEAKKYFQFNHGIVNMEAWTLCANVRRSVTATASNNPQVNQAMIDRLTNGIVSKLNAVVTWMSQYRRWTHWAIELFISDLRDPPETKKADLDALMNSKQSQLLIYRIGRLLELRRSKVINSAATYPMASRIVLQAYDALGNRNAPLLDPMPSAATAIYNDLVNFIITEYTRFFTQGEAILVEKVSVVSRCKHFASLSQQLTISYSCGGQTIDGSWSRVHGSGE